MSANDKYDRRDKRIPHDIPLSKAEKELIDMAVKSYSERNGEYFARTTYIRLMALEAARKELGVVEKNENM